MKSPATDIAYYLQLTGVGTVGVDIFVGSDQPPEPDDAIFIQRTGATQPNSPNLTYEYPTVQIIVRAFKGGRQECDAKVELVTNTLHGVVNTVIGTSYYVYIFDTAGAVDLPQDQVMRPLTSINFMCQRAPV